MFFDNQPLKLHSCQCWQTPFFQAKSALILVYLGKNQHHIPDQISQNCCLSRGKSTGKYHIVDKNPGSTIMDQQWMLVNSQRISACFLRFLAPSGPSAQHGSNFRTVRRKGRFRACGNDHPWINMAGKSSINRWCSLHGFGDFPRLMSQLVFIYGLRFAKFVPVKKKTWKTPKRRWLKSLKNPGRSIFCPFFICFCGVWPYFAHFLWQEISWRKPVATPSRGLHGKVQHVSSNLSDGGSGLRSEERGSPNKWGMIGMMFQIRWYWMILDDTGWYWMILDDTDANPTMVP